MSKARPRKVIFHPVANMFPLMEGEAFDQLVEDLRAHGQRHKIITLTTPDTIQIIDGRNRYLAQEKLGNKPEFEEWNGKGSLTELSASLNMHRRHLTTSQKAAAGVTVEEELSKEAKLRMVEGGKKKGLAKLPTPDAGLHARDRAAELCGVSSRSIGDAKLVRLHDEKLFEKLKDGTITLGSAKSEVNRQVKLKAMVNRPVAPPTSGAAWDIILGDNAAVLPTLQRRKFQLIVADPQYNIGVDYGKGSKSDQLSAVSYLTECKFWMEQCAELLTADGTLIIVINDENAAEFVCMLKAMGLVMRGWIKWYETFGVNCTRQFNRTSRHLLYFVKNPLQAVFNEAAFKRPSARQETYGDKRANPNGKLWDDVWVIPRLVDNAKERMPGFPTQLPMALIRPIVEGFSDAGAHVLDPFNGSGTTGEACVLSGRQYLGIEKEKKNVEMSRHRLQAAAAGERPCANT